ncbi:MAG: stage II sporulation protein R [Tissierellia bacterium]|nr:stage II sporulation protein R [Tissierellia bacterium]
MRCKKLLLVLVLLIISIAYIIQPHIIDRNRYIDTYKDNIIRFHVRANSDREEDQILKLKIRDRVLDETSTRFMKGKSIEDARRIMKSNLDDMESIAQEVIAQEGMDLPVQVSLGPRNFPTRRYGDITLPSGEYETLQIDIGEGKGKNWWCIMFPPLCFVEMGHGNGENLIGNSKEGMDENDMEFLSSHKEPTIVLKSKIMEFIERTRIYFAEDITGTI